MKTSNENEQAPKEAWHVPPYSKRELAEAYAPNISAVPALNRLAQWFRYNLQLSEALLQTGYKKRQQIFTSMQVELIFRYLGRP